MRTLAAAIVVLAIQPAAASAETISVNNTTFAVDHSMCGVPGEVPCVTIQYAANNRAQSGDTVLVSPGTYTEQVDVTKALTIQGAGQGLTIIRAPDQASLVSHGVPGEFPVVTGRTAGPLTIKDLTIDGRQQGFISGTNCFDGIHFFRVSGTIDNVRITGVRTATNPENDCGSAIYAANATATGMEWRVSNSRIDDSSAYGSIFGNATGTGANSATLVNNTFSGPVTPSAAVRPLGLQTERVATTLTGNTFSGFSCVFGANCGPDLFAYKYGIAAYMLNASAGSSISGNTFSNNDAGLLSIGTVAPPGALTMADNRFVDNRSYGFLTGSGEVTATANRFEGGGTGAVLAGIPSWPAPNANLRGSTITGAERGIYVTRENTAAPPPTGSASANRIVGNAAGVVNDTVGTYSAENNWWGCNGGPGQTACDTVTGPVDSDPHLVLGLSADPAAILTGGAVSNLTASVATNSAGEVKGGGFPDGNAVGFATDLGLIGAQPTTVGGLATSTLTSGDTAGYANVSATLDGQTVTTPVTIGTPPPDDPQPCTNAIKGKKKGDKLVGTAEGDVIKGKAGNDKITGGAGEDCLKGGPGKDKIKSRDGEVDQVNCGPGKDRVKADKVDVVKKNCEKVKAK